VCDVSHSCVVGRGNPNFGVKSISAEESIALTKVWVKVYQNWQVGSWAGVPTYYGRVYEESFDFCDREQGTLLDQPSALGRQLCL
jgi:hypothetical protein